jgi:hypothetical protein
MYRPGKSGAIQKLPDTKPVKWAITGRKRQNLRYVQLKRRKGGHVMTQLPQQYTNAETGISYILNADGYYLPDLTLPDETKYEIGIFGIMRKNYLKNHRKAFYSTLLTTGKLNEHLFDIDQVANDRMEFITKQMAEREGVTEQLKTEDQMLWIQKQNSIHNRVQEIIRDELIYS